MNVKNNNTSDVSVSIESFTRVESNTTKNRNYDRLEIVAPNSVSNWNTLSEDKYMKKISLGIFFSVITWLLDVNTSFCIIF